MSRIWMILLVDDEMVLLWGVWRVSVCALARLHCAGGGGLVWRSVPERSHAANAPAKLSCSADGRSRGSSAGHI